MLIEILARDFLYLGRSSREGWCVFAFLGLFEGLGGCGQREGIIWSGLLKMCGCSDIFGSYLPVLGPWLPLGLVHSGFWGALWGL